MVVAKRQGREIETKEEKTEQRKGRGPEWGPQVEQTALLAGPGYIGQAQGEEETYKKRSQRARALFRSHCLSLALSHVCVLSLSRALSLSLFCSSLLGLQALMPRGCIFLYFLNKTELSHEAVTLVCLRAVTLAQWRAITLICHLKFLLWWDRTKELHSPLTVAMLDCCRVNWHAFINLFNSHLFRFFFFWPL